MCLSCSCFWFFFSRHHRKLARCHTMRWESVRAGSGGPGRRWGHTCNAVDGGRYIYVFGGYGRDNAQTNDVHIFDAHKQTWSKPMMKGVPPSPRDSHSCTTVGNKLFVFGGTDGRTPLKDLHILDASSNTWIQPTLQGNGPDAREGHSAALVNKRLFIFGGCGKSMDCPEEVYYNDLYILDTEKLVWECAVTSGRPPSPRDSHTCSSWRNKIIVLGGEDSSDCYLSDVHILDADTLSWRQINTSGQMLAPRAGHTTVAVGSNLYVFGGFTDDRNLYDDLHVLNLETGIWSRVTNANQGPCARFSVAGDCLDEQKGILVFMGGCNKNLEALNDMYYLHTDTKGDFCKPSEVMFEARITNSNQYGYEIETVINGKVLHGMIFSCTTSPLQDLDASPNKRIECASLKQYEPSSKTVKRKHQEIKNVVQGHKDVLHGDKLTSKKPHVEAFPSNLTNLTPNDDVDQSNMAPGIFEPSSMHDNKVTNNEAPSCPSKPNPENPCESNLSGVGDRNVKKNDAVDGRSTPNTENLCENLAAVIDRDVKSNDIVDGPSKLNAENPCENPAAVHVGDVKNEAAADSQSNPNQETCRSPIF